MYLWRYCDIERWAPDAVLPMVETVAVPSVSLFLGDTGGECMAVEWEVCSPKGEGGMHASTEICEQDEG